MAELMKTFKANYGYLIAGVLFGIIFVKAEIISWFRIQEMFRLESIHMYGVIGTAVVTGMVSVFLIKKFKLKALNGEAIVLKPKKFHRGVIIGGFLFGIGCTFTGACPGPLYVQIGSGYTVILVTLISALSGVWIYGWWKEREIAGEIKKGTGTLAPRLKQQK